MHTIGFTSGFDYKHIAPVSPEVFRLLRDIGCRAVEINCVGGYADGSLAGLAKLKPSDLDGFEHISLHAPTRVADYRNDKETKKILSVIGKACDKLNISFVVIHPTKVADWNAFDNCGFHVAVENMDQRRPVFQTVGDLAPLFQEHDDYLFVLDVAHCWANDCSLKLARDLYDNFRDRLCEIHASGYDYYHRALHQTGQVEIIKAIPPDADVPIILEGACDGREKAREELEFVKKNLEGGG